MGTLRLKGAALGAWMEFRKQNRRTAYGKSIRIDGFTEGKKGSVTYRMPTFALGDISPETLALATELDRTLQEFLDGYLSRAKQNLTEALPQTPSTDPTAPEPWDDGPPIEDAQKTHAGDSVYITDDDIPF